MNRKRVLSVCYPETSQIVWRSHNGKVIVSGHGQPKYDIWVLAYLTYVISLQQVPLQPQTPSYTQLSNSGIAACLFLP